MSGWTTELTVRADAGKVPNDPVEAAKYGIDQAHHISSEWVTVRYDDGVDTTSWLVDTSSGEVTRIGTAPSDPDRDDGDERVEESVCEWSDGSHHTGMFRCEDMIFGEVTYACGNHLVDTISGVEQVMVTPYTAG